MTEPFRKAVILIGFEAARTDGRTGRPSAADRTDVLAAVEEALDAGLHELMFVTCDSVALADERAAAGGALPPKEVVVSRHGRALSHVRRLVGAEPIVVLVPGEFARHGGPNATARLLADARVNSGNLAAVTDRRVLERDGVFAAIGGTAAGRYVVQPAVLDALAEAPERGLAGAILAVAEAWPVAALPLGSGRAVAQPAGEESVPAREAAD